MGVKKVNVNKLLRKGKALILAYDQGLEHGPTDFNERNVDPLFIIDLAKKGGATALVFGKGLAEKYKKEIKKSKIPLILKLNGKTKLSKGEPYSPPLCTVKEAIKLGASAVGYTIYFGSSYEAQMLKEFEVIEREAHAKGLAVVVWSYPRGKDVPKVNDKIMAYATRAAAEVGADIVKVPYTGHPKALKWAVKDAARTKVVISGGMKAQESKFLKEVVDVIGAGACGFAIGRNIWQSKDPIKMANKIRKLIWN